MTPPHFYVPALKVKGGEKKALGQLAALHRARVLPLLEIVEPAAKPVHPHLDTAFNGLAQALGGFQRCLLDCREIAVFGSDGANEAFSRAGAQGMPFTPVTGISRTADVVPALAHRSRGIALRVSAQDLARPGAVQAFLGRHGLKPAETDLIVDLGDVSSMVAAGISLMFRKTLGLVPHQPDWRTLTLMASAFPLSMGCVPTDGHALWEREEWVAWRDDLFPARSSLARLPWFGDHGIQHPKGVEGFDPVRMQASAAIRYALEREWLLLKGRGSRAVPLKQQFPRLAAKLVQGNLHQHFRGPGHCAGCAEIAASACGAAGFGSPAVWRRIGTVHHITVVAESLAALPWP